MLWELRCARDHFSVEAAAEKGRDLPQWFMEEPDLYPGDDFYLKAFRELSSCRSLGMSIGPIPWRDMIAYSEWTGLEPDMIQPFIYIMQEMDRVYLDWVKREQEARDNS